MATQCAYKPIHAQSFGSSPFGLIVNSEKLTCDSHKQSKQKRDSKSRISHIYWFSSLPSSILYLNKKQQQIKIATFTQVRFNRAKIVTYREIGEIGAPYVWLRKDSTRFLNEWQREIDERIEFEGVFRVSLIWQNSDGHGTLEFRSGGELQGCNGPIRFSAPIHAN